MSNPYWLPLALYFIAVPFAVWLSYRMRDCKIAGIAGVITVIEAPDLYHLLAAVFALHAPWGESALLPEDGQYFRETWKLLFSGFAIVVISLALGRILGQRSAANAAIVDGENRFKDFAESASDWLWETDAGLRFTYMSPNVEQVVGVAPEWHYGKTRQDLLGEDYDREIWDKHLADLEARKPFRNFLFRRVGDGIETRWLRSSGKPVYDDNGTFIGYRGVGSDVTEEMEMQRKVAQMEERFRLAIESMDQGFVLCDQDDCIVVCNDRFKEINADIADVIAHGVPFRRFLEALAEQRKFGAEWVDTAMRGHQSGQVDVILRFSNRRWIRVVDRRTGDGGYVGLWTDVTELKEAERSLEIRVGELKLITDNVPVLITHVDADLRIRFLNAVSEAWYQAKSEHARGHHLSDMMLPQTFGKLEPRMRRALKGETVRFDETLTYRDGKQREVELIYVPERDGKGAIRGIFALGVDVTERRRLDREQRRNQQKIADLVEGSLQGVFVTDADWRILFTNPAMAGIFGYDDVDDLMSIDTVECLLPLHEVVRLKQFRDARLRGEEDVPDLFEIEGRTKDGRSLWLLNMSRLVEWDGQPAVFTSLIDVTERHRLDRAKQRSDRKMAHLLAASLQGIFVYDGQGRVLFTNEMAATIFKYDGIEDFMSIGNVNVLVAPEELERLQGYRKARLHEEDAPTVYEFEGVGKTGESVWAIAMSRAVDWDGEPAIMTSVVDMTDRHKAEEQLRQSQKMEAVGQLTGGIAHDFNNMLTVIQGNADMLSDMLEPGSQMRNLVDAVMQAAERSAELTQRLLAFSRQQPLSPKAVDVARLLGSMCNLLSRTLGDNIDIKVDIPADLDAARVDPGQLENAILNLSINARDAMPDGGRLILAAQNVELDGTLPAGEEAVPAGRYIEISVTDTGTGMTPEIAARVFEPFFTTKEVGRGTGLGLSMVYGFARQSQGFATICSTVGLGTSIKIFVPVADDTVVREAESGDCKDDCRGNETVLLVEDDDAVAAFTVNALKHLGYKVIEARNGPDGLAQLEQTEAVDLLLTDVVLPGDMNGRQVAEAARRLRPDIRVLFSSGYAQDALGNDGRIEEGLAFLPKPFTATALAQNVRAVLDGPVN